MTAVAQRPLRSTRPGDRRNAQPLPAMRESRDLRRGGAKSPKTAPTSSASFPMLAKRHQDDQDVLEWRWCPVLAKRQFVVEGPAQARKEYGVVTLRFPRAGEGVGSMRKTLLVPALVVVLLLATVAGAVAASASYSAVRAATVTITTRKVPKLGVVLVDGQGRALYMFAPDKQARVTCKKACAAVWPPVKLAKGQKLAAAGGVKRSLLGSDPNPAGGRVVTYNKWPLYTYVADTKPGQATGQALNLNGGLWYVLAASGKVIRTKPGSG
jgi:predicted lipoprotein with Yx(FWY)xxD motif